MGQEFKIKNGLVVSGSAEIENNLTVRGRLTADEYHVSIISSSVLYESGSTKFGDSIDDNHAFTGSVSITGSINLNGQAIGTGKLDETTFNSFTSSYVTVSGSINTRLGSLENFSSSIDSNYVSEGEFGTYTGSLNSFTSSTSMTIGALNNASASIRSDFNSFTSSYTNVSSSLDTRLDNLESFSSSLDGPFVSDLDFNSFTSSVNPRLVAIETSTGSLNSFTSSIASTIKTKLNTENVISGSIQVNITGTTGYSTFSSSIATTDSDQDSKIATLQTATGALNTFTSSAGGRLNSLESTSGSINTFTASALTRVSAIETATSSLNTFTSSVSGRLTSLESASSSIRTDLNSFTSSTNGRLTSLESASGSIRTDFNTFTSSASGRLTSIESTTGSLNTFTSSIDTTIKNKLNTESVISGSIQVNITGTTGYSTFSSSISSSIGSLSGSIATTDSNQNTRLGNLETSTGSLNTFTSSALTRVSAIETATSSLNSFTSSIATTIKNKLNSENVVSGSSQIDITSTTNYTSFSSSIAATDLAQNNRITTLDLKTGSYATTGSNVFVGNQTVSGSLIVTQNLTVFGSSSIVYITSSQLRVDDNIITLNTSTPGQRFGGIEVYDSGSLIQATGSILWDSVNNRWIYQQSSEATYGGGVLMSGPRSSGSLGSELTLTSNRIAKSAGGDHLNDSNITDNGTTVSVNSNTEITGSLLITGTVVSQTTALVSGSGQISYAGITNIPSGIVSGSGQVTSLLPAGTVSGSSQVLFSGLTGIPSGIVSGSSQVTFGGLTGVPSGLVSGSSQVLAGTTIHSGSFFNGISVVSGSAQIDITATTNYSTYINQAVKTTSTPTFAGLYMAGPVIMNNSTSPNTNYLQFGDNSGWIYRFVTNVSGTPTTRFSFKDNGDFTSVGAIAASNFSGTHSGTSSGTNTGDQTLSSLGAQAQLNGTGFVKASGTSISYDNSTYQTVGAVHYVGTTSIANNRSSASQTLTGVSIDGSAATVLDTNIGSIAGPLSTTTTAAGWAQPSGFNKMVMSSGSSGLPSTGAASPYYGYTVLSRRDAASGYSGILIGYNNDEMWFTYNTVGSNYATWKRVWHEGNLTNLNQLTNGPGYITGITSGNVTTALGYTPYNSTNPNGYITGITSGNVTTALGYTPYNSTNPNGYISGISFANVSSKPTTISGYGITDAITTSNIGSQSVSYASTAGNITAYTINQNVGSGNSPSFVDINLSGGLTVGGSLSRGTYTVGSNFVSGADNIVLKGNSSGVSGIYFESEKDGTSINYPSDFGFIQFHPYGVGGSTGEQNRLVIGVSNDSDDMIVLNPVGSDGVKVRVGTGTTEYTVYHSGNIPTWNQNTTGTASNITSYTINQSVGTGNSPTFAGITLSGPIYRSAAGTGYLNGNYSSVETPSTSGAIYTIGGSYVPGTTSLGNMYGIGYGNAGGTAIQMTGAAGWGMYVAGNGTIGVFLAGEGQASVFKGHIVPHSNNSYNLGSATYGWANVYTNDLHLSNMNKPEGNDIDGTSGTWTIQEGAENLYIINNRNGKKFKISLEEI